MTEKEKMQGHTGKETMGKWRQELDNAATGPITPETTRSFRRQDWILPERLQRETGMSRPLILTCGL